MMKKLKSKTEELNVSSTADIAFLLLIFFLVATTIVTDKGLTLKLPPKVEQENTAKLNSRNIFNIQLNSKNQLLVNNEVWKNTDGLNPKIKAFVMNKGQDPKLSDSPSKAVVSIKTNRGTNYKSFIEVLDLVKGTYFEIYADEAGMTKDEFLSLNLKDEANKDVYLSARKDYPMNISIAEPN